ncbi:MAG TPA: Crp/Fnr family transcriptional regulator [Chloroflexota bacterium]|jgi:CRP-like cAMP-binding protein|nr:Crp/Fnr family transcriptional regulator [Chloroflexota bacterium]
MQADEFSQLRPVLETVQLQAHQHLALPEEPMERVYFPRDAVVSMIVLMDDGRSVECAAIGNEGLVGLEVFLGDGRTRDEVVVQISGEALSLHATDFRQAIRTSPRLQRLLQHYSLALMNQLARTAGCNRVHSVEERCARWLLMSLDRVGRSEFGLTHEFLAKMLGVRRASVSQTAEHLQRVGLIDYRQGWMRILDRAGLEDLACEDYRLSSEAYDQLY